MAFIKKPMIGFSRKLYRLWNSVKIEFMFIYLLAAFCYYFFAFLVIHWITFNFVFFLCWVLGLGLLKIHKVCQYVFFHPLCEGVYNRTALKGPVHLREHWVHTWNSFQRSHFVSLFLYSFHCYFFLLFMFY
jgi:hypothetical protein